MKATNWDKRFLDLAKLVSTWSKDPSSQVGAVIVDKRNRFVSLGFNGLPVGIEDTSDRLNDRPTKLALTIHAEENAILFAQKNLEGMTIYVTHPPCSTCASKIIQVGISKVVFPTPNASFVERWASSMQFAASILEEAGVTLVEIS